MIEKGKYPRIKKERGRGFPFVPFFYLFFIYKNIVFFFFQVAKKKILLEPLAVNETVVFPGTLRRVSHCWCVSRLEKTRGRMSAYWSRYLTGWTPILMSADFSGPISGPKMEGYGPSSIGPGL